MLKKSILILCVSVFLQFCSKNSNTPQKSKLRVAIVQLDIVDGDLTENMLRAELGIREAVQKNADIVCLTEVVDFGWLHQQARRDALPIPGEYTDFLAELSEELNIWISAGCLEKDSNKTFNAAVLINREGKIVLRHRKINTMSHLTSHLYDSGSADSIKVVDTEFGRTGITICADNFDIENPKKVAELGAWLLIIPHCYATPEADLLQNAIDFGNHIRNIAKQTKFWVIGSNICLSKIKDGEWKGYLHSGCSIIADPTGKVVTIGKYIEPDIIIYDIICDEASIDKN